ncbi:MAG: hypothetical protein ACMXYC_01440 [Candidatus Woesearchaeota archaeon]
MSFKINIIPSGSYELLYQGDFHYLSAYKLVFEWLTLNGYKDVKGDGDRFEYLYSEIVSGAGKEIWWWWRTTKKADTFIDFYIDVDCHVLFLDKKQKIVGDNKFKTNSAEISFFITPYIKVDQEKAMEKNFLTKYVSLGGEQSPFYNKVYRELLGQKKEELYVKSHELINVIKQHFGLMMHRSLPKPFHNPYGVPQFT